MPSRLLSSNLINKHLTVNVLLVFLLIAFSGALQILHASKRVYSTVFGSLTIYRLKDHEREMSNIHKYSILSLYLKTNESTNKCNNLKIRKTARRHIN